MPPSPEPGGGPPPATGESPRRGRIGRKARTWLATALGIVLIAVVGLLWARGDSTPDVDRAAVGTIASGVVEGAIDDLRSEPATSAVVYQQILPSLVRIDTRRASSEEHGAGLGSGVIVNASGAVLTAHHVVDDATSIRLSFVDGTRSRAVVATADPENDIAVLVPERTPEPIVPAVLGGGGQVGDEAYAVGHPLGYTGSLTAGVISGLERSVRTPDGTMLRGLIQFDAAVNPGSSGGPLLNRGGQVIGIVTALAGPSRDGYFAGVGFAVPIGAAGGAADAPPK